MKTLTYKATLLQSYKSLNIQRIRALRGNGYIYYTYFKSRLDCVVFRNPCKCTTVKYLICCENTLWKILPMSEQCGGMNLKYVQHTFNNFEL